jgi:hypothetical protein
MKSRTTERFRKLFRALPDETQKQGREAYRLFKQNPHHPSLRFKHIVGSVYSVRITLDYRAVCTRDGEEVVWFWVGSHSDYNRLVSQLRRG